MAGVNESEPLLNFTEAARRLRVSARTIRRQADAGRLQTVKVGRCHRITPQALAAFLATSQRTRSA